MYLTSNSTVVPRVVVAASAVTTGLLCVLGLSNSIGHSCSTNFSCPPRQCEEERERVGESDSRGVVVVEVWQQGPRWQTAWLEMKVNELKLEIQLLTCQELL